MTAAPSSGSKTYCFIQNSNNDTNNDGNIFQLYLMGFGIFHWPKGLATKRKAKRYWQRELGCWPPIGQFVHQSSVDSFAGKRSCLGSWKILRDWSWEKWSVSEKVKYNGQCMGKWNIWYWCLNVGGGNGRRKSDSVKYQPYNVLCFRERIKLWGCRLREGEVWLPWCILDHV